MLRERGLSVADAQAESVVVYFGYDAEIHAARRSVGRGDTRKRNPPVKYSHAKNKIAGRFIPFLVLGFWNTITGICAGAMPYRRDFLATAGI